MRTFAFAALLLAIGCALVPVAAAGPPALPEEPPSNPREVVEAARSCMATISGDVVPLPCVRVIIDFCRF